MTTTTISLNKLIAWDGNVRKTDSDKAISELAASIAAYGLLQSLVVRKDIDVHFPRSKDPEPPDPH
ncbi:MAG: hypothetical protein ACYCPD_15520 [Acidobacteriaceae bacterium]